MSSFQQNKRNLSMNDEDAKLWENSCQTQTELALTLGVIQQTMAHCLKSLGGNSLLGINDGILLHRLVVGDEKYIHYDNTKKNISY